MPASYELAVSPKSSDPPQDQDSYLELSQNCLNAGSSHLQFFGVRIYSEDRYAKLPGVSDFKSHPNTLFPYIQGKYPHLVAARQELEPQRIPDTVCEIGSIQ